MPKTFPRIDAERNRMPRRLGMITPSSNTVLEPIAFAMLRDRQDVTVHFSRLTVTQIALSPEALDQFTADKLAEAAMLLGEAKVDVIAWNGTSAGWLGFASDERLCELIARRTGVPACTSVLAFREVFARTGVNRIGLVTPYRDDLQATIMANWGREGLPCVAERHLGLQDNFSFSEVSEEQLAEMIRDVIAEGAEAVAVLCTNLRGGRVAARMERELGVPVYDSVVVTVWKSLLLAGANLDALSDWGSLFTNPVLTEPAQTISQSTGAVISF
jgi:maleate isomerase